MSNVQVTRARGGDTSHTETALPCRVMTRNFCLLGLVEGHPEKPPVDTNLDRLDRQSNGQVLVRCMNSMELPLTFGAGLKMGTFTAADHAQMQETCPGPVDYAARLCGSTPQQEYGT